MKSLNFLIIRYSNGMKSGTAMCSGADLEQKSPGVHTYTIKDKY